MVLLSLFSLREKTAFPGDDADADLSAGAQADRFTVPGFGILRWAWDRFTQRT
jgi:hypothetical protein